MIGLAGWSALSILKKNIGFRVCFISRKTGGFVVLSPDNLDLSNNHVVTDGICQKKNSILANRNRKRDTLLAYVRSVTHLDLMLLSLVASLFYYH